MQGVFVLMLLLVTYQANNRGIIHSMIQIFMSYSHMMLSKMVPQVIFLGVSTPPPPAWNLQFFMKPVVVSNLLSTLLGVAHFFGGDNSTKYDPLFITGFVE